MTETTVQPPPGARLVPPGRHQHSASQTTPTQFLRPSADDFISQLSPMNAIETLRSPSGTLKTCMDTANPAEESFAMRAAVASKNIYEWLVELQGWAWSAQGGVGFQAPASARAKPSSRGRSSSTVHVALEEASARSENSYIGSLLESDLSRYEMRIGQIQRELEKLEIEDIKKHVLQNHIHPLSRPGTPASPSLDRHFGMSPFESYVKMDDVTAVITATVVQALPNLSKLIRLMNTWSVRLTVLRRIPTWLEAVEDAESSVKTELVTIESEPELQSGKAFESQFSEGPGLSKEDFDVTKLVLEKKVSRAGRILDYMLDTLEGRDDTLPEDWIDRMEAIEREFTEWIASYDKKLREAELAALRRPKKLSTLKETETAGTNGNVTTDGEDVVINVEHVDDPDKTTLETLDPDHAVPSVESGNASSASPTVSITNEDGQIDLSSDELSLYAGDTGKSCTPGSSVEIARPSNAMSNDDIVVHEAVENPTNTPELSPMGSDRGSPHTPPREMRSVSLPVSDMPSVPEDPEDDDDPLQTPLISSYDNNDLGSPIILSDAGGEDDHMRQQISHILESLPAKIHLSSQPGYLSHLNPPDLQLPYSKPRSTTDKTTRSKTGMSSRTSASRAGTPSFMLAPVPRSRQQRGNQDIKMYHLSRANGEAPIKLFIRCVGEHGERVMVRVGGGWADLGEYLKEYAIHHGRRSNQKSESRLEVRDVPRSASSLSNQRTSASPPSRPGSALDTSPIFVKKTRKSSSREDLLGPRLPRTPLAYGSGRTSEPPSAGSAAGSISRSRSSSHLSSTDEDITLGMAGPRSSRKAIPQESLEWVESIKNKVRAVSGGSEFAKSSPAADQGGERKFGQLGKVGGTKRVFRKAT